MTIKSLRWLFLLVVLGALLHYVWTHADEFRVMFVVRPDILLVLLFLHALILVLLALTFYRIACSFGLNISFVSWLQVYSVSRLLNAVVPQSANAYRVAKLKVSHGFPIASYAATLIVFSMLNRIYTLMLALGTVLLIDPSLQVGRMPVAPLLAAGVLLVGGGLWLAVRFERRHRGVARRYLVAMKLRPSLVGEILAALHRPSLLVHAFIWTSVNYCLSLLIHRICFALVGAKLSFAEIALFRFSRSLIDTVPLTPGNLGVAEAVYGALSVGLDRPASEGVFVSAIMTVMSILAIVVAYAIASITMTFRARKRLSAV